MDYQALLERARTLAERGRGVVEPNPMVAAIALQDGRVVGEGWHQRYGAEHAEERALEAAIVAGAEPDCLVVTLEPCSSRGCGKRRPPCTSLILEAGIRQVVVGTLDPDPRHAGRGFDLLAAAGVDVVGPFDMPSLEPLLARFRASLARPRPWVLAKWAMTLDGKTATRTASSRWISGEVALDWSHDLRAGADAVLVGIRTALEDDPELTVRRVAGKDPMRVVLDPDAVLPLDAKLFGSLDRAPLLVFVAENAEPKRLRALRQAGAEVRELARTAPSPRGRTRIDLAAGLRILREECGLRRLLVEGGGETLALFFDQRAIDEVAVCIAPKLVGGREAATPLGGIGLAEMRDAWQLEDVQIATVGDCAKMSGFVQHEQESASEDPACQGPSTPEIQ